MKKIFKIFILLSILLLSSCTKIYHEIWVIEKYPIEWEEEITIEGEHLHFEDDSCNWKCLYYDTDTFCWQHYDTIVVKTFEKKIRIK
jgi:hypothetical protein